MPRLGVGTYLLKDEHCQEIIQKAIILGYRHIDTAHLYGNEKYVGKAIQAVERHSSISRKQLFVTSKVSRIHMHPDNVRYSLEESLDNLKTGYIDMLLIHMPFGLKNRGDGDNKPLKKDGTLDCQAYDLNATWKAMEDSVKEGKVKSIGLSNFTEKQIQMIMSNGRIKPQNLQFECHAYYQQNQLKSFCDKNQIFCTAYAPLGAPGRLVSNIVDNEQKVVLLEDETVLDIARKYERTPAQILLRFLLERNMAVVPKTSCIERLEENISVFDFELEQLDAQRLQQLDRGLRFYKFKTYQNHPYFPKENEPF